MLRDITTKQWLCLLTVQMCTIVFGVTITSVTVILPQMKGALAATQDQMAWILTLNLVATAVATPLTGWLAAKLGWRRLMVISVLGFSLASAACGMVDSLNSLLVLRVIQGALGAPIFPMGQTIILAKFERQHHALAIMMWGVGGVMGPILGPTFGGMIAEFLDWRWSFYMILPLGLTALIPTILALGDEERGTARRFDFMGFVFIAIAIGALQLMLDRGQRQDWFQSLEIVIEGVLVLGFFYLFLVHSAMSKAPLFQAACFRDRNFTLGILVALVMGMLQYTPMVLFPALLQDLRGYPEAVVGSLLAMRGVGNFLSFLVVTPLTRWSARGTLAAGLLIQAAAAAWMGQLDINMTSRDVFWCNLIHGFGFGLAYTPMTVLAFSTLDGRWLTQGNAIFSLLRMLGSSIFIAVCLVVFVRASAGAESALGAMVTMFDDPLLSVWRDQFGDTDGIAFHLQAQGEVRRQAAMIGYINAFHLLTIAPIVFMPLVLLFRLKKR